MAAGLGRRWLVVGGWRRLAAGWRLVGVPVPSVQLNRSNSIGPSDRSRQSFQAGVGRQAVVGDNKGQFCDCTIHETAKMTPNTQNSRSSSTKTPILCLKRPKIGVPKGKSAQKPQFCAQNARKWGFRKPKKHKNLDFVLEMPENEGSEGQKRTKTSILCSKRPKMGVPEAKKAQKPRFCAREEGDWQWEEKILASGSATVAFLQITAHTPKTQKPHNQIVNF